jgi:hypothetical protein
MDLVSSCVKHCEEDKEEVGDSNAKKRQHLHRDHSDTGQEKISSSETERV